MPENTDDLDKQKYDIVLSNSKADDAETMRQELIDHIRIGLYRSSKRKADAFTHLGYIDRYIKIVYPNLSTKHKLTDEEAKSLKLTKSGDTQSLEAKNIPLSEVMEAVRKTHEVHIERQQGKTNQG